MTKHVHVHVEEPEGTDEEVEEIDDDETARHPSLMGAIIDKMKLPIAAKMKGLGHASDALHKAVSALYAKILVILGLALPMSEAIADKIDPGKFEGFYLYLFLVSLLFLLFLYVDLMQVRIGLAWQGRREHNRKSEDQNPEAGASSEDTGSFSSPVQYKPWNNRPSAHYGSFYLRLGTVLFGIGSMIYSGIEIGLILDLGLSDSVSKQCKAIVTVVRPTLQIIFVFAQMHFIFLNQKMNIFKHKFIGRMGLMHMLATNLCVWLHVIIEETNHEMELVREEHNLAREIVENLKNSSGLFGSHHEDNHDVHGIGLEVTGHVSGGHGGEGHGGGGHGGGGHGGCGDSRIMSQLLKDSGPFLFPCTIEFSLICAAILFVMWKNVAVEHQHYKDVRTKIFQRRKSYLLKQASMHEGLYSVDCTRANTGLFCGIIVMVSTLISIIIFFVFISNEEESKKMVAVQVSAISELALYVLTTVAVLVGMCQVRSLWYDVTRKLELDNLLLIIAQTGVFFYATFCIIGSFFMLDASNPLRLIPFLASLATLLQTTLQTIFILDASCRFAYNQEQVRKKPGREMVTFLLVCNLAMWMINTIETNRTDSHPVQNKFYGGNWAWPVITHISMPLAIFYRFHSTVCLFEIWKKSFKYRPAENAENVNFDRMQSFIN